MISITSITQLSRPFVFHIVADDDVDPSLPIDLEEAATLALIADATLMSPDFGLKGGLWPRNAPPEGRRPNGGWPYGILVLFNPNRDELTHDGDFVENGLMKVVVSARSRSEAKRLAGRAMETLAGTDLQFQEGHLLSLRPENPDRSAPPAWGSGGYLVWSETRTLHYEWNGRVAYPTAT